MIRQLDDPSMPKICQPSAGVHIVLPDYYSPTNMGLLDPNTSDGRVIFFLPWQKHTMAGLLFYFLIFSLIVLKILFFFFSFSNRHN